MKGGARTGKRWTKPLVQQLTAHVDDGITKVGQLKEFFPEFTEKQITMQLQKLKNASKIKIPLQNNDIKAFQTPVKTPLNRGIFGNFKLNKPSKPRGLAGRQ